MDRHLPYETSPSRPNSKRKLEQEFSDQPENDRKEWNLEYQDPLIDLSSIVRADVKLLHHCSSNSESDRAAARQAASFLCKLAANEEHVDTMVELGAVPALVRHLKPPETVRACDGAFYEHEVEKGCALALGFLAIKPEHQQLIVDAGALPYLVDLLKRHKTYSNSGALAGLLREAADTITNLAHQNSSIKTRVRVEAGIPLLVELLEYNDIKVQTAAAGALRTLAFQNYENKKQIVECNALPTLVLMLWSEDTAIHYEAVGLIGNLVHTSPNIKKEVLLAGALQPIIGLLSSRCMDSQREAALLVGQFAAADSDCKVHIAQRGAVQPLIDMLQSADAELREMSAFALGRLAQDTHTQAGIAHNGGIEPLVNLLGSESEALQRLVAYALYALADNEDNVTDIIKAGGVQKLQDGDFEVEPTKEYVEKTLKILEKKMHGRVLKHLVYLMRSSKKVVQRRVVLALAHLCAPDDYKTIFIDNNGLELLLDFLVSTSTRHKRHSSMALDTLAKKATSVSPVVAAPPSRLIPQVQLCEQYFNNPTLSDITFLVEGKRFYAHKICLVACSETFRAMFDGGYRETESKDMEIPNIKWDVFELMMRFIYTGTVYVNLDIAEDLLRAADQYLLDGLKCLCEDAIVGLITTENVFPMYELSQACNAMSLRQACILFVLEQFDKLREKPWYCHLVHSIIPYIREKFPNLLTKLNPAD